MEAPEAREVERVVNQIEASRLDGLERVGGFGGKADRLNAFYVYTGNPDYFNEELARYKAIDPSDIQAAGQTWLTEGRGVLSVVPEGQTELASEGMKPKTD
jgi:zinc protease